VLNDILQRSESFSKPIDKRQLIQNQSVNALITFLFIFFLI